MGREKLVSFISLNGEFYHIYRYTYHILFVTYCLSYIVKHIFCGTYCMAYIYLSHVYSTMWLKCKVVAEMV